MTQEEPALINKKLAAELLRRLADKIENCAKVRKIEHNDWSSVQSINVEWEP